MRIIIVLVLIFSGISLSQSDWKKWDKADLNYQILDVSSKRNYSFDGDGIGDSVLKSFVKLYWVFISDLDGDNCSFSPTCSEFFVQAVKRTNILQGTLMFADRFTRDLSLLKLNHYPRVKDGHFYDPVSYYSLDLKILKINPTLAVINTE